MNEKPPTWDTCLEQVGTRVPHLQTCDYSKLSHASEYAPARFGWEGLAVLPSGPPKPPNIL
jgi:hypothetical protein